MIEECFDPKVPYLQNLHNNLLSFYKYPFSQITKGILSTSILNSISSRFNRVWSTFDDHAQQLNSSSQVSGFRKVHYDFTVH